MQSRRLFMANFSKWRISLIWNSIIATLCHVFKSFSIIFFHSFILVSHFLKVRIFIVKTMVQSKNKHSVFVCFSNLIYQFCCIFQNKSNDVMWFNFAKSLFFPLWQLKYRRLCRFLRKMKFSANASKEN